jgi:exopolysaccharide biosynthesis polyprenyl glycosylphosphotransferase
MAARGVVPLEASVETTEALATSELTDSWQAVSAGRAAVRRRAERCRARQPLAIIGSGDSAARGASLLCHASDGASRCTVVIDTRIPSRARYASLGLPIKGPLAQVSRDELAAEASEFVLAFAPDDAQHAALAIQRLINEGLDFCVMPESLGCVFPLLRRLGWDEIPVLSTRGGLRHSLAAALKRVADVCVAALTLILLLPLLALVALLIRVESPGPAIFTQQRVGKNGRSFRIYKFRTMVVGAQATQAEMTLRCSADPRFIKIECDPRVTRLGRILRMTSIDELPQLWNVIRGQMSLVGPRPSQPSEVEHYEPDHFTRLLVKPGVTGMWQVSGRSDLCFEDAMALDSVYVRERGILLDIKIMLKTVMVVLRCRGAC